MLHRSSDLAFLKSKHSDGYVVGCDEAGRGPLAGPVVAAAVLIMDHTFEIDGICDSKATKEEERDALYDVITSPAHADKIIWAAQVIDHKVIDEINILEASLKAMREAAEKVLKEAARRKVNPDNCIGLIDGNKIPKDFPCEATYVIKGDSKVYSIAMASIIAKVTRDKIMLELDKQYPIYNLAKHKGYPTLQHRQLLWTHGPSEVHRLSYAPVKQAFEKHGGYTNGSASRAPLDVDKPSKAPAKSKSKSVADITSLNVIETKPKRGKAVKSDVEVTDKIGKRSSSSNKGKSVVDKKKIVTKAKPKTASKAAPKAKGAKAGVDLDIEAAIKNFVNGIVVEVSSAPESSKSSAARRSKSPSKVPAARAKKSSSNAIVSKPVRENKASVTKGKRKVAK